MRTPKRPVGVVIEDPDGNLHGEGNVVASAHASKVRIQDCTPRQQEILFGYRWEMRLDGRARH